MNVLFVSSGNPRSGMPIVQNQANSLKQASVDVEHYYVIGNGLSGYVKNFKSLRRHIKKGKYDIIHAHYSLCGYLASISTMGVQIPIVVSLMGSDLLKWWHLLLIKLFAKIKPWKAVIVKSNEMKNRLGMECAIVLPNGVNMERFREMDMTACQEHLGWNKTHKHVLFPANPAETRKNWPLAENAVKSLNEARKYEIELHGMVGFPNEETPICYNAVDAVVLPSFYEGSANAVKEAMACNRPIVTTDMGDCRERLEGLDGCYVANTYDVEEFANLLQNALDYNGRTKGRERLLKDELSDSQVANRMIKIYESL